ncbi:hypothetical protein Cs7R123_55000 [Catellatospora sp. TT07R-123]|uniref:hypothetical protein n=1 Tax=Catellatospora sp. TT07R-123 TaxID=2733863 RepID=UPI001B2405A3|nr:hypothetical protein [Catellatospora sp. TT07R-123]GHJ48158.1 hypothetical protein Cs7R123_55000 [Catellatospora sp. TT07R-123]
MLQRAVGNRAVAAMVGGAWTPGRCVDLAVAAGTRDSAAVQRQEDGESADLVPETPEEDGASSLGGPRSPWKPIGGGYVERYWPVLALRPAGGFRSCNMMVSRPDNIPEARADAYLDGASQTALKIAKAEADANPWQDVCFFVITALREVFATDQLGFRVRPGAK